MAIKREELLKKREEIMNRIDALENENKSVRYTCNRYFEGFGMIEAMDKDTLILAYKSLADASKGVNDTLAELGFEKEEEDNEYLGFTIDEWKADLKRRAQVIRNEEKIIDLEDALDILENNLSDDDRFALDMEAFEELTK